MKQLSIPQISDEELMRRYLKIKPIAEVGNGKYWLKNYSIDEMRNKSYFYSLFHPFFKIIQQNAPHPFCPASILLAQLFQILQQKLITRMDYGIYLISANCIFVFFVIQFGILYKESIHDLKLAINRYGLTLFIVYWISSTIPFRRSPIFSLEIS